MARIDLNVVDRGTQGSLWMKQDCGLTSGQLDNIVEQRSDNAGALNSLPTPFARFFVADEAFRRVAEEYKKKGNPDKEAGQAYRQLVSDILDVHELLFNLKYHRNNTWKTGEKLEIREWDSVSNLKRIQKQMPRLYNSIDSYYKGDIREDKLYFLVFTIDGKELLLACSSPYTGFVTPPDMDKVNVKGGQIQFVGEQYQDLHILRKSGGEYFRDIVLFEDRDADFKNYLYNEVFAAADIEDRYKHINSYIKGFKNDHDIRNDFEMKLATIATDQNEALVVNDITFMQADEVDVNSFFTSEIIRVPYRIDRGRFTAVIYKNDKKERDYDYLLPFKPEVMNLFQGKELPSMLQEKRDSIVVSLEYYGKTYEKEYSVEPIGTMMGRILDLRDAHIRFDLGIFPNILSHKEQENNYFKVMAVAADEDKEAPVFNIDQLHLSFFKKDGNNTFLQIKEMDPSTTEVKFCLLPAVVRSRQKTDEVEGGTKFYELYNTSFDLLQVKINQSTGLLLPKWERSKETDDVYTYAVDLGTSNTFISRSKEGENNKPHLFEMERPMISYLHESPKDPQLSLTRCIEDSVFDKAKKLIKTEFLPPLIDGSDYKFPIRTALCSVLGKADRPRLFDNCNIAFFYERVMANDDQRIRTDIKWEKNDDLLRVFIRELLLIIKCDLLQRNGDVDRTRLIWFRPLSFLGNVRSTYQQLWAEECENVLGIQNNQISCFSESEAPYYYFKKQNYIKDSDAVSVVDIGGGSTDFVYFKDNQPVMANSVHFGCDVLWENGFVDFENARDNGIFKRYEDTIRFVSKELSELNSCFINVETTKTKDIINFWLSNSKHCDIKKRLSEDYKPLFVYHLTSILYYMAEMYKEYGQQAPRMIVFSGNGSRYIDDFITSDRTILQQVVDMVFECVFGGEHQVYLELPKERKESTCYGGLYRGTDAPDVQEKVYQGDLSAAYEKVGDISAHFDTLKKALQGKYAEFSELYKKVLDLLKRQGVIDNEANTSAYVAAAHEDMMTPLNTYYKSEVKEKLEKEVVYTDSVFFLPIINRIFEMTRL